MGSHDIQNMKQEIEYLSRLITVHKEREKLRTSVSRSYASLLHQSTGRSVQHKPLMALKRKFATSKVPVTLQSTKFTSKPKTSAVNPYKLDRTNQGTSDASTAASVAQLSKQKPSKSQKTAFMSIKSPVITKVVSRNKYKLVKCHKETPATALKSKIVNKTHMWKAASLIVKKYNAKLQQSSMPVRMPHIQSLSPRNSVNLAYKLVRSVRKRKLKTQWCSTASTQFHPKHHYCKNKHAWARPNGNLPSKTSLGYTSNQRSLKNNRKLSSKIVSIGGILYKASKNKLSRTGLPTAQNTQHSIPGRNARILVIRGIRFQMDSIGRTLKRVSDKLSPSQKAAQQQNALTPTRKRLDIGRSTYVETKPGVFVKTVNTRYFISYAVNRSIRTLRSEQRKLKKQYCMFYNRFGRCNKGGNCPYIHDPEKVAICTRFLRGTCKVDKCPFAHKILPDKMPACSFFLQGRCNSDHCPYQHVKVNSEAGICMNFVKGYCASGVKCTKMHVFVCPQFSRTGSCPRGRQCPLIHREKKRKRRSSLLQKAEGTRESNDSSESSHTRSSEARPESPHMSANCLANPKQETELAEPSSSKASKLPSYISLADISPVELPRQADDFQTKGTTALRIRPLFLTKPSS